MIPRNSSSLEVSVNVLKDCLLSKSAPISHLVSHHASFYISQTLLQHHRLYHYLLYDHQPESHTKLVKFVETGEKSLPPLSEGLIVSEWEKREKVREIEEQYALKARVLEQEREEYVEQEKHEMKKADETLAQDLQGKATTGFTESDIKAMVQTVTDAKTRQFLESLSYEMACQKGSMDVKVDSLAVQTETQPGSSSPSSKKKGKQSPNDKSPKANSPRGSGRASGRKS